MATVSATARVREDIKVCRPGEVADASRVPDEAKLNAYVMEVAEAAAAEPASLLDTLIAALRRGKSDKD